MCLKNFRAYPDLERRIGYKIHSLFVCPERKKKKGRMEGGLLLVRSDGLLRGKLETHGYNGLVEFPDLQT